MSGRQDDVLIENGSSTEAYVLLIQEESLKYELCKLAAQVLPLDCTCMCRAGLRFRWCTSQNSDSSAVLDTERSLFQASSHCYRLSPLSKTCLYLPRTFSRWTVLSVDDSGKFGHFLVNLLLMYFLFCRRLDGAVVGLGRVEEVQPSSVAPSHVLPLIPKNSSDILGDDGAAFVGLCKSVWSGIVDTKM